MFQRVVCVVSAVTKFYSVYSVHILISCKRLMILIFKDGSLCLFFCSFCYKCYKTDGVDFLTILRPYIKLNPEDGKHHMQRV